MALMVNHLKNLFSRNPGANVFTVARVSEKEGRLINVAGSGIATQDSTGWDGVASRAVDGIIDGSYFEG